MTWKIRSALRKQGLSYNATHHPIEREGTPDLAGAIVHPSNATTPGGRGGVDEQPLDVRGEAVVAEVAEEDGTEVEVPVAGALPSPLVCCMLAISFSTFCLAICL